MTTFHAIRDDLARDAVMSAQVERTRFAGPIGAIVLKLFWPVILSIVEAAVKRAIEAFVDRMTGMPNGEILRMVGELSVERGLSRIEPPRRPFSGDTGGKH
jgi:cobalamin biosynthesis protein CobD/CbiB